MPKVPGCEKQSHWALSDVLQGAILGKMFTNVDVDEKTRLTEVDPDTPWGYERAGGITRGLRHHP
jgi:hypothetical protein